jgi:hypothetical protein
MNNGDFISKLFVLYTIVKKSIRSPLHLPIDYKGQSASDCIKNKLLDDKPCMICRYGNTELRTIIAYLNDTEKVNLLLKYIKKYFEGEPASLSLDVVQRLNNLSGFFPLDKDLAIEFVHKMIEDTKQIDILATWKPGEYRLKKYFSDNIKTIYLHDLSPYLIDKPWTKVLKNKRILVIHPFVKTIRNQYQRREYLFKNKDVLPQFDLKIIPAVQSIAENKVKFENWFEALDYMCKKINNTEFDIALIGAGAYGLPLAAHVKKIGKKAIHLAGEIQVLFGIKGKRWDNGVVGKKFYNDYWVRPLPEETPDGMKKVEKGCYW